MEGDPGIRILLVEDDLRLGALVSEFLVSKGFVVDIEVRGDLAPDRIIDENPDLVILDLMLPGLDGLSICRKVRPVYPGPIMMLTALSDEVDE
ncbi:MAG TPA: response regulator, partial [Sedimentisphaerales bacterium]|nr:response regulator [Sedimentisphaerales bacterium]